MLKGLITKQGLDERELADIRELAELCEAHDGIRLKLNWDMLEDRPRDQTNDILYHEGGRLVGFLGIYVIVASEAELSGMVHPDWRRRGIFTQLMEEAMRQLSGRGPETAISMCTRGSASGSAFLKRRGIPYSFSEYLMERKGDVPMARKAGQEVVLRLGTAADLKLIAELDRVGFGMPEHDAEERAASRLASQELTYIIESDGRAVGKLSVMISEDTAFIYGFCMRPEERGRGIGRAALAEVIGLIERERGHTRLQLEVAVDNERALGLYESCGFRQISVIDYYKEPLA